MVVLIVSWGLKKKKKVLGRPPIQNPVWIYWTQIHTVVCTMYFLSFVTQLLPLRLFGSFPSPMSPNCLLKRMLCMVTSNVQVQPSCWPQGLTALPGWNTLGVVGLKSFFLFFFFLGGGQGEDTNARTGGVGFKLGKSLALLLYVHFPFKTSYNSWSVTIKYV